MTLFMKRFIKFLKKSSYNKGVRMKTFNKSKGRHSSRRCYESDDPGHFIAACPNKKDKKDHKKKEKFNKKDKSKYHQKSYNGQAHICQE